MAANKFGGKCIGCSKWIEAGEGVLVTPDVNGGKWGVTHGHACTVDHDPQETVAPVTAATVPNGLYALEREGAVKFYEVRTPTEGKWAGYTFVDACASDDRWPIKNRDARQEVLSLIADDPEAASIRYGRTIGRCGRCNRTLTDEHSRAAGIGPECAKKGW